MIHLKRIIVCRMIILLFLRYIRKIQTVKKMMRIYHQILSRMIIQISHMSHMTAWQFQKCILERINKNNGMISLKVSSHYLLTLKNFFNILRISSLSNGLVIKRLAPSLRASITLCCCPAAVIIITLALES